MSGLRRTVGAPRAAHRVRRVPKGPAADLTHAEFASLLGERIRERRLAAGLSQADLAGSTLSRFAISKIELGRSLPSLASLRHIAHALGVSSRDLIGPL